MNAADISDIARWRRTAETWVAKTYARLLAHAGEEIPESARLTIGWEGRALLTSVLADADQIVRLLDEEQLVEVERYTRALLDAIRAHRLAGKLRNVAGRTPEEAETFMAAAARMEARP